MGFASSQLTSLILPEISAEKSGVASGANSTVRQLGSALGAALVASIITVQTSHHALAAIPSSGMSETARAQLESTVLADALAAGARWSLVFVFAVTALGALLSLLIPRRSTASAHSATDQSGEWRGRG